MNCRNFLQLIPLIDLEINLQKPCRLFLPHYFHFNFLLRASEYITDYFYIFFDITCEFKNIYFYFGLHTLY